MQMKRFMRCVALMGVCFVGGACFPTFDDEVDDGGDEVAEPDTVEEVTVGDAAVETEDVSPPPDGGPDASTEVRCNAPTDCAELADACLDVECVSGRCVVTASPDGKACDDGDLCSDGDACAGGVCVGTPRACEALGQCRLGGACDPLTGECSSPLADDGTSCDDGDPCTRDDACAGGFCVGGERPSSSGEVTLTFGSDEFARVDGVVEGRRGAFTAALFTHGDALYGSHQPWELASGGCGLWLFAYRADGTLEGASGFTMASDCTSAGHDASLGLASLGDGSFAISGRFREPLIMADESGALGQSHLGLLLGGGVYLARFAPDLGLAWGASFIGFPHERFDGFGRPAVATNSLGASVASLNVGNGSLFEVVDGFGASERVEVDDDFGDQSSLLYRVQATGAIDPLGRFNVSGPGLLSTHSVAIMDDGSIAVAGFGRGEPIAWEKHDGTRTQLPRGIGTHPYVWVVVLTPAADVSWARAIFVPPVSTTDESEAEALPAALDSGAAGLSLVIRSRRELRVRDADDVGMPLEPTRPNGEPADGEWAVLTLDPSSGLVSRYQRVASDADRIDAIVVDELGLSVAGLGPGQAPDDSPALRPRLWRVGTLATWEEQLVRALPSDEGELVPRDSAPLGLSRVSRGGTFVYGEAIAPFSAGAFRQDALGAPSDRVGAFLMRLNRGFFIDCR